MTLDELQEMQDDLLQKIWMLTLENDMYERYLTRQDPQGLRSKEYNPLLISSKSVIYKTDKIYKSIEIFIKP
ncbi:hypothetical protein K0M31_009370 [Melipona bicolor]|uniref:Uncharacterized protein n=1 Tax=Melipona bicolor TaxID=60889 RepID=A0AA40FN31_9HYME|nr:hypothetical protein K0M31_009370 [Melipona bicolor]